MKKKKIKLLTEEEAKRYLNENIDDLNENIDDEDAVMDVETARKIIKDSVLPLLEKK